MCDYPSDGENLEVAVAKYRYARVFLAYLDAAETLQELRESLPVVQTARDLIRDGRDMYIDYREASRAMERVLGPRSSTQTMEGLEYPVGRFDVDLEMAEADEARCWEALVDAVEAVPRNEFWDGCYGWRWFEGGMDAQRDLLVGDAESADRIWHYKRALHDMLFESTLSPDALEVNYRLCYGKLVDTVPFAI